jgi:hypothetical protein
MECRNCNHDCHCKEDTHIDEYLDVCPCDSCNCKEKDADKTWENEVVYEK